MKCKIVEAKERRKKRKRRMEVANWGEGERCGGGSSGREEHVKGDVEESRGQEREGRGEGILMD